MQALKEYERLLRSIFIRLNKLDSLFLEIERKDNKDLILYEFAALNLRIICESIGLLSICVNQIEQEKLAKRYHTISALKPLFKELAKRNPDFLPKRVEINSDKLGMHTMFIPNEDQYINIVFLDETWKNCSSLLHATNPTYRQPDLSSFLKGMKIATDKFKAGLGRHVTFLTGSRIGIGCQTFLEDGTQKFEVWSIEKTDIVLNI